MPTPLTDKRTIDVGQLVEDATSIPFRESASILEGEPDWTLYEPTSPDAPDYLEHTSGLRIVDGPHGVVVELQF